MRVPPCLLLAGAFALMLSAGPALAGDAGADAGTGGAGGMGTTGAGGSGGAPVAIQPTLTPDNFGCSTAGPFEPPRATAGLLLLGVVVGAGARRRRRARLPLSGGLS